jgi:hypothetical protein
MIWQTQNVFHIMPTISEMTLGKQASFGRHQTSLIKNLLGRNCRKFRKGSKDTCEWILQPSSEESLKQFICPLSPDQQLQMGFLGWPSQTSVHQQHTKEDLPNSTYSHLPSFLQ